MQKDSDIAVEIYTDGACSGNPGPGGWGAILIWPAREVELFGGDLDTTNNRMEMKAVIEGLSFLHQPSNVVVYTDSQYVQKGMTLWIGNWKNQGFRVKGGGYRTNHDLWKQLDGLSMEHQVKWQWVRGHSGNPMNERADQLARGGIDKVLSEN